MIPQEVDNLIVPVAVSASHIGFSTIRMEPAWMALGEAAGIAAYYYSKGVASFKEVPVRRVQERILDHGGTLVCLLGDIRPRMASAHGNSQQLMLEFTSLTLWIGSRRLDR
ncbi:MAG: FAD-dependent oxidoreductase [Verrucomicrobia bacterium]|nr:FAD-dependent oxidoreductase [Verrucomicrobiota bacterium]